MKATINNIIVPIEENQDLAIKKELIKRNIDISNIMRIEYVKRSIDSRKKSQIKFLYNLELTFKKSFNLDNSKFLCNPKESLILPKKSKNLKGNIAIIGSGPAGLFAALRLCELGYKPIIFERGEKIDQRNKSITNFYCSNFLDINSNIQFGEGGAGTYSDGKLNSGVKSKYTDYVFKTLVELGAPEKILWDYKPHIGTDLLKIVIKNLENKIVKMGAVFYFNSLVENIIIKGNRIEKIEINNLNQKNVLNSVISIDHLILAIGHSARDTYRMLSTNGVFMESKPFAAGARIEHPRVDIDKMQYGKNFNHPNLEAATYSLTYNNQKEKRGVFSFCMCPGGVIVNAASTRKTNLVNGMSYSKRDGKFSNSAIVVGIKFNEFGAHLFSGMEFQEQLEEKAYSLINNYGGLSQRVIDFIRDIKSTSLPESSYPMRLHSHNLNNFFPKLIKDNLKQAFNNWEKIPNFISNNAILIGPETRTSAPVRITRDEFGESVNTKGIYPIGEGAGYAGGITSSAIDGLKIIDNIFAK